jgi:SAM-dependent methyltransferase
LGWIIASLMAHETWAQNRRAIDALGVARGDHVLDIGCGPGRSLATLANLAPKGRVVGGGQGSIFGRRGISSDRHERFREGAGPKDLLSGRIGRKHHFVPPTK